MADSFYEVREPYKEGFEELYNKAKEENVSMSNAKDFLNSLTKDELSTLQHYTMLADNINVDSLDDEGAYNLLLHHYEKYDFNNDGLVSNGISKGMELIPSNMPKEEKEVFVKTLNEMNEKDRFVAMAMITPFTMLKEENGKIIQAASDKRFDYDYIMNRLETLINPPSGAYTSEELKASLSLFKEALEKNYEERVQKKEELNANLSAQANIARAKINS
jgi:hypothetical protein